MTSMAVNVVFAAISVLGTFNLTQELAELFDRCAIDYPRDAAVGDGAHAHRTRLAGTIDRRAAQDFRAMLGDALAECDHLAVCGRVLEKSLRRQQRAGRRGLGDLRFKNAVVPLSGLLATGNRHVRHCVR